MSESVNEDTPEFYRRRYDALKAQATQANARRSASALAQNPADLSPGSVIAKDVIPGGCYWTGRLARGHALRITNGEATPGVSVMLWNSDDTSERFNHGDSVKLQWTVRLGAGKLLFSDMGRVLASITDDRSGWHDAVLGGSTPQGNARKYGPGVWRNARENFLLAAAKQGMGPRDLGPVMNFFAPVVTDDAGHFAWQDGILKPGEWLDLRAEMNLIVAISNTPHPLSPGADYIARPIGVTHWRPGTTGTDDFCRTATEEAVRAFENTDAYFCE